MKKRNKAENRNRCEEGWGAILNRECREGLD